MGCQSQSPLPSGKWHLRDAEPRPLWAYGSRQQDLVRFAVNNAQRAIRGHVTVPFTRSWKPTCRFLATLCCLCLGERVGRAGWATSSHAGSVLGSASRLCHAVGGAERLCCFYPTEGPSPPLSFGKSKHSPREAWRWNSAWAPARAAPALAFSVPPRIWEIDEATRFCGLLPEVTQSGGCPALSP